MSTQPSLGELAPRATANLLATYLAIGRAFPGSEIRETDGYLALLSDLPHPSGNFAARLRLDPWSAGELRALAATRPAFQAVALPDDGPEHLPELLRRAGFEPIQRLVAMIATPAYGLAGLDMAACEEPEDRRRIGRFMADVFFARESISLRMAMAEAVVEAAPLSVYGHLSRERPVAAVTLMRSEGMLGIYNLCVAGAQRGRGLGASLVAWCLAQAAAEGCPACLQCVPTLEPWYARHGFVRSGSITVWAVGGKK